jgi:hypothetical protein
VSFLPDFIICSHHDLDVDAVVSMGVPIHVSGLNGSGRGTNSAINNTLYYCEGISCPYICGDYIYVVGGRGSFRMESFIITLCHKTRIFQSLFLRRNLLENIFSKTGIFQNGILQKESF